MAPARCITLVAVGAALSTAALAADDRLPDFPPGEPGLYEVRTATNLPAFLAGGNLSEHELQRWASQFLAQTTPVFQLCTLDGALKEFDPASLLGRDCIFSNVVRGKDGYSAEARCRVNERTDLVHIAVETDTPEHRKVTLTSPMPGTSLSMASIYEVTRISSDCGDVPPGRRRKLGSKIVVPPRP